MKNMKKKVIIIAAMVLLLATVLVMSMSTFAKYSSTATTETQTAVVAKWGLTLQADATNLFGKNYAALQPGETLSAVTTGEGVNVKAATAAVAPGTTGSMTFVVAGTAEVPAEVEFALNMTSEIKVNDYYPIKWTLHNGTEDVVTDGTVAQINAWFAGHAYAIDAGASTHATYTLTWEWAFDGDDANDTLLGQAAAGVTVAGAVTTMAFTVNANFVQVQRALS